jgi:hypothetical protein
MKRNNVVVEALLLNRNDKARTALPSKVEVAVDGGLAEAEALLQATLWEHPEFLPRRLGLFGGRLSKRT